MRPLKKTQQTAGFTLAEMLTTLAIIGVLLALLIPALSMVEKKAKTVKQRAQFHAIEVGLEAFRSDWGDYPPSEWSTAYGDLSGNSPYTCASQRLAEALIGRDGLGFHPLSQFRAGGRADLDGDSSIDPVTDPQTLYSPETGFTSSTGTVSQTGPENRAARKGPYLELETANATMLSNYYNLSGILDDTYVLADAFAKKMTRSGLELGMPILYYRAHTDRIGNSPIRADWPTNTYDLNDSYCNGAGLIFKNVPFQSTSRYHPLHDCDDEEVANRFYGRILNPNFTSPARPYRANSFLLHSAGPDGLYGSPDDMFNF